MTSSKTLRLVTAALFAALTCVATMVIQIPTPVTSGYIHLGDGFVILSGIFLGPLYGALAAGIGSMLADLLTGYMAYAPITFVIKALAALAAGFIFQELSKKQKSFSLFPVLTGGIFAALIVAFGYFIAEAGVLGYGAAAAASIPHNLVQGAFGVVISAVLSHALVKVPFIRTMTDY